MDSEMVRPIFSGLFGGAIAMAFCRAVSRWVPEVCNGKMTVTLLRENRVGIWVANALFLCGFLVGIGIYQLGLLPNNDWRGLAIGVGGGSILAIAALPLLACFTGSSAKEAYVAFAVSQKTPIVILYGVLVLFIVVFAIATTALLFQ
jgi:hypothetical protein